MKHIITKGISSNCIEIPSAEKECTQKIIELCDYLINKGVLYIDNNPYNSSNLPEFISDINKLFSFELDIVYDKYISEIKAIQQKQLDVLNYLNTTKQK